MIRRGVLALVLLLCATPAWAAISASVIEVNAKTSVTSQNTGNFASGGTGQLALMWVYSKVSSGTANQPTITGTNGWNGTWTAVNTQTQGTFRITLFRVTSSSTTAGVATIDFASQSQTVMGWNWLDFTGVNTTTSQGVVQSAIHSTTGTHTSESVTLAAFGSSSNGTVFGMAVNNNVTITAESGYTDGASYQFGASLTGGCEWRADNDTTPSATFPSANQTSLGIGAEIEATVAASTFRRNMSSGAREGARFFSP